MPLSRELWRSSKTGEVIFRFNQKFSVTATMLPQLWINSHIDPVDAIDVRSKAQVARAVDDELFRYGEYAFDRSPIADDWEIHEDRVAEALGLSSISWREFVNVIRGRIAYVWTEAGKTGR